MVMDARETVATFRVSTSSGRMAEASPPNSSVTRKRYPVWEKTPTANRKSTSPATWAIQVVKATSMKQPTKKTTSWTNQGTSPKNRYHTSSGRGSMPAMRVSLLP